MTFITYDGPSDYQEFGAADFKKADIDQGKLVFQRGVPKEVSDEVAEALTSTDADESPIFHDFSFSEAEDPKEAEAEEEAAQTKSTKKKAAAKKSASSQTSSGSQSSGDAGDDGSTGGNGSSTGGSTGTGGTAGNGSSTAGAGA